MIVIVGGSRRKVGKTTAVCDIILATSGAGWTAIKITSHSHGADLSTPVVIEETCATADRDTGRYLLAGARRSVWIRCASNNIGEAVHPWLSGNVIIESNSAAAVLPGDLLLLVSDGEESKPSAEAFTTREHSVIAGRVEDDVLLLVRQRLTY